MENSPRQNPSDRKSSADQQLSLQTQQPFERKNLYERYTNYIDSSKCTIQHYEQKKFFSGQQKYIHKINSWIEDDSKPNKPLVFKTEPGCGIKTILINWQKNQSVSSYRKEKSLSIMHFASNGSNNRNYFYSLYRIIIKLREALKLKQNVDLLEENIRKFFAYWLDICSSEVEKQLVIYCAQDIYHKIVIIIEGVDQFIDAQTGKQANIAFWLPQLFPKNVKVIVTAAKGSESLAHLEKNQCQVIQVKPNADISSFLLKSTIEQQSTIPEQTQKKYHQTLEKLVQKIGFANNTYTFIEFYRGAFLIKKNFQKAKQTISLIKQSLSENMDWKKLESVQDVKSLYNFVIDFWLRESPLKGKLESILIYLCLTQKGLSAREIVNITKITENEWNYFLIIFNHLIIKYEGIYSIKSTSFIQTVFERDRAQKGQSTSYPQNYQQILIQYHQKLAIALDNTTNCIRKLQEQTYHLFAAKSYFKLKEMISNIQNFLLMFNPNNKYELSKYWQKLEEKGFDPVIEYNKAVQGFSMHYHPSDENIFRIIVQISRFLKEFCDFQTYQTPNFRHPYIEGNAVELHKIGLLKEFSDLDIFYDNSFNNNEQLDLLNQQFQVQEQIKELRQKYFPKQNNLYLLDQNQNSNKSETIQNKYGSVINEMMKDLEDVNKKKIKKKNTSNVKILSDIQQLNVDVPMNREKFRNHYLKTLQQFMKKDGDGYSMGAGGGQSPSTSTNANKDNVYLDVDQVCHSVGPSNQSNIQYSFNKIRENYRMRQIKPSLYYYKRWIWIQFPWVCISLNTNYSTTPQLCKKIEGDDFDTLQQQAKYTKQALLVAIEARQKKRQMFTKKEDLMDGSNTNKSFASKANKSQNLFTISKFNGSKFAQTSSSKARLSMLKVSSTVPDLSLNALTKDLQIRRKRLNIQDYYSNDMEQSEIFLSEINQNCQQDMKFISLRKQFVPPSVQGIEPNQVLPKLKWVIKEHTNYQLNYIKAHIQEKKKKLNKIIYENKKLGQTYQQLKIKESLTKKNLNQHESEKNHKKNKALEDLLKKKQEVINEFCKSLLQKERLKIILKLCSQNKTKNQEYLASLNYLLQNLKKMISFEKQNMKSITEQLEEIKVLKDRQNMMENQKQKNKQIVQKEAQNYLEQKNKLQKQIENITAIISQDIREQKDKLENSLSGHIKNKEEKTQLMMQEKKTKLLEEKLERLEEQYQCLRELFEFQGFDFQNAPKFKKLMQQNQRNKKLKIAYFERKNKLEQVMNEYERIKQQNEKEVQDEIKKMSLKKDKKECKDKAINQNTISNQVSDNKYAIILDNIALKLGVKDKRDVVKVLKEKLNYLKQHNPQKYIELTGKTVENNHLKSDLVRA